MLASAAPTPEKSTLRQEIASALSDAADRLPKPLRDVFALCAFSGLSLKEAAAALGLTVSATKTRLFRAHALMRSDLQPVWSDVRIHGDPTSAHADRRHQSEPIRWLTARVARVGRR
jgi:DNA-directed RNA polymerase specialized sigma24 family protein